MQKDRDYAGELKKHELDNDRFDRTIGDLEGDRSVGNDALRGLVGNYLGYVSGKAKTRGQMVKAMTDRQALRARQDARSRTLDKRGSWGSDDS